MSDPVKKPSEGERRNEQLARAAKHAAGIGMGWFAMTLLARQILDRAGDVTRGSYHDKLKDYVNARYPSITPQLAGQPSDDEAVRDIGVGEPKVLHELESKTAADAEGLGEILQSLMSGVAKAGPVLDDVPAVMANSKKKKKQGKVPDGETKTAADKDAPKPETESKADKTVPASKDVPAGKDSPGVARTLTDRFINPVPVPAGPVSFSSYMKAMGSGNIHPMHMVLTLAAALAGIGAGSIVSSKLSNKREADKLDTRIVSARSQLDRLLASEYRRTRGLDKSAAVTQDPNEDTRNRVSKVFTGATKAWLIYAAGVAALAYAVSKNALDKRDPNRVRLSALQDYAKDRARMSGAPMLNEDPNDPGFRKLMTPAAPVSEPVPAPVPETV